MTKGWILGQRALIGSLVMAHVWGSLLVVAVYLGKDSDVIGRMFESIGFMIFSTLGVLVGGKAWKDFAPLKWGASESPNTTVTKTETTETKLEKKKEEPDAHLSD